MAKTNNTVMQQGFGSAAKSNKRSCSKGLGVQRSGSKCLSHWEELKNLSSIDWHANFLRLFCKFCRRLLHDIRASVTLFMCRELVGNVLIMFKNFMQIFLPKYFARLSRDCHATFV